MGEATPRVNFAGATPVTVVCALLPSVRRLLPSGVLGGKEIVPVAASQAFEHTGARTLGLSSS